MILDPNKKDLLQVCHNHETQFLKYSVEGFLDNDQLGLKFCNQLTYLD